MVYLQLTLITAAVCFVIDLSGFYDSISAKISGWLTHGKRKEPFYMKPFSCSTCMSWWIGLLWVIVTGNFGFFSVMYALLMGYLAPHVTDILRIVSDALSFLNNKINSIFQ